MNNQNRFPILFGIIFGAIGSIFFALGLVFLTVNSFSAATEEFLIVGSVFAIIGAVFLSVGVCFLLAAHKKKAKAERLMRTGVCYDCEIVRVYDNLFMNINYRHPFVAECVYTNERGETCLVKSGNTWRPSYSFVRESDIGARVWVNPGDPADYYVEILFDSYGDFANIKYDRDYR